MPKPTQSPLWATDANYTADGDPWSGTPTKVDPGASRRAEGAEPDTFPAQWFNWIFGAHGDWLDWLDTILDDTIPGAVDLVYETPQERTITIGPQEGKGETNWSWNTYDSASCSSATTDDLFVCISDFLPSGAVVQRVRALVKPGTARTSGNRMELDVYEVDTGSRFASPADPAETLLGALDEDVGSNAFQLLDSGVFSFTLERDTDIIVARIRSGNTSDTDRYYGLQVSFLDPGPRNY